MKTRKRILLLNLFVLSFIPSCSSIRESSELDYSLYYSYRGSFKGIEIYCWQTPDSWFSGILPGTNRFKTIDEVLWLQENLPCPLEEMANILLTYSEEERECALVCIVSNPPTELELKHDYVDDFQYLYVYEKLGLKKS